jgi:hypothetical protein
MEEPRHPVASINYPKTFQEFDEWFGNDDAYIDYIASMIPVKCLAE